MKEQQNGQTPVFLQEKEKPKATLPTTFELAQLATQVPAMLQTMKEMNGGISSRNPPINFYSAVQIAMELWADAELVRAGSLDLDDKAKTLFSEDRIFNVPTETYDKFYAEVFTTNPELAIRLVMSPTIETELCIKKLFRDKSDSPREKRAKFLSLADFGVKHEIPFIVGVKQSAKQIRTNLEGERISPMTVRWVMDAHQKRLSLNKSRDYVPKNARRKTF